MKIAFIGSLIFSEAALNRVLGLLDAEVVGVATLRRSVLHTDFRSLSAVARAKNIPCLELEKHDPAVLADWVRSRTPDVIYAFGWPRILDRSVLDAAPLGAVGYHPTLLPRHRGRHPIIWALTLGLAETGSTFFFMDEGADSGDILHQARVAISDDDDAASLYSRLTDMALDQIAEFTPLLARGRASRLPQDEKEATSFRKRTRADGQIDWRMPAEGIRNLIRALVRPYPGAHCRRGEKDIKIWKALRNEKVPPDFEPGRILAIDGTRITVKCGVDAVDLIEHEFSILPSVGEYL